MIKLISEVDENTRAVPADDGFDLGGSTVHKVTVCIFSPAQIVLEGTIEDPEEDLKEILAAFGSKYKVVVNVTGRNGHVIKSAQVGSDIVSFDPGGVGTSE